MKGRENVYTCDTCGGYTVTIDRDSGVTPFMLGCRASGEEGTCKGMAYSAFYPKEPRPARIPPPAWEWYAPDALEIQTLDRNLKEHVERGGLLIRKLTVH